MAGVKDLVSIKMVADRLMRNPLMKDLNYEFIVDSGVELLQILKAPSLFFTKKEVLHVKNYRSKKPIDMMSIDGIVRIDSGMNQPIVHSEDIAQEFYNQGLIKPTRQDGTYTLNSKYINLNFEEGTIAIMYKVVAVDEDCYPLVLNDASLLRAMESYIRFKWYDILNDIGTVTANIFNKAETEYMFNVGQAQNRLIMPSYDEMEALVNSTTQILPSRKQHSQRFEFLGAMEQLKIQ